MQLVTLSFLLQQLLGSPFFRQSAGLSLENLLCVFSQIRVQQNIEAFAYYKRIQQHPLVKLVRAVFEHGVDFLIETLYVNRQFRVFFQSPLTTCENHTES